MNCQCLEAWENAILISGHKINIEKKKQVKKILIVKLFKRSNNTSTFKKDLIFEEANRRTKLCQYLIYLMMPYTCLFPNIKFKYRCYLTTRGHPQNLYIFPIIVFLALSFQDLTTEFGSLCKLSAYKQAISEFSCALFQNESKYETFYMKMSSACSLIFVQIKVIFIRIISHLDSL